MFRIKPVVVAMTLVAGLVLAGTAAVAEEGHGKDAFRTVGKVKSKSGNTFTLETRKGEIKVRYDANTRWVGGTEADLKEGAIVGAAGTKTNDKLHASKIGFPKEGQRPPGERQRRKHRLIRGEVTEVRGHNFTLKTRRGDVKVVWDANTKFHNGTAEDVKVGAKLGVAASPSGPSGQSEQAQASGRERTRDLQLPAQPIHAQHVMFKADCERPAEQTEQTAA